MADVPPVLSPRAPFASLSTEPTGSRGVMVCGRDRVGMATVLVRRKKVELLAQRVREHFRIELPQGPHRTTAGDVALIGTGPGAWLAIHQHGGNAFAIGLRARIGDLASVSDQSDGYAVLRLSGPRVLDTLVKLLPIDVHPRVFESGRVATTVAAHVGVTLWRLDDSNDGSPVFEVAVCRSFATSFCRVLSDCAAEFDDVQQFRYSLSE